MKQSTVSHRSTTKTKHVEHVRYHNPHSDRGHLFYVGTRSAMTRFAVIGLHHYWSFGSSTRGLELTYYPKHHDDLDIIEARRLHLGPLLLTWKFRGSSRELYVWYKRRRFPRYR